MKTAYVNNNDLLGVGETASAISRQCDLVVCTHALFPALVCPLLILAGRGHRVWVYCNKLTTKPSYDHDFTWPLVSAVSGIQLRSLDEFKPVEGVPLWIGFSHWLPYPSGVLTGILDRVGNAVYTMVYDSAYGGYVGRLKAQIKMAARFPRLLYSRRRVHVGDPARSDLFGVGRAAVDFFIPPSTDFFVDPALLEKLAFDQIDQRSIRLCFGGASHASRAKIVKRLGSLIGRRDRVVLGSRQTTHDYIAQLRASDFALCLPGGLVWSHRIMESLLCGCIPILGPRAYKFICKQVPREAVVVTGDDYAEEAWYEAVSVAVGMTDLEIAAKRSIIVRLTAPGGPLHGPDLADAILKPFGWQLSGSTTVSPIGGVR